jgi:hypothetical protein
MAQAHTATQVREIFRAGLEMERLWPCVRGVFVPSGSPPVHGGKLKTYDRIRGFFGICSTSRPCLRSIGPSNPSSILASRDSRRDLVLFLTSDLARSPHAAEENPLHPVCKPDHVDAAAIRRIVRMAGANMPRVQRVIRLSSRSQRVAKETSRCA